LIGQIARVKRAQSPDSDESDIDFGHRNRSP
jgi:hypothetical protein